MSALEHVVTSQNHSAEVTCPVCGAPSVASGDIPGWGTWRRCTECTLEFADPLRRGRDAMTFFDDAYRGRVQESAMEDFGKRVALRRTILDQLHDPSLWFWTPAFSEVLDWLKRNVEPGASVLELGCGLGFFLHALRKAGFNAVGLDVAEHAVELNRADGFEVWHGAVETLPDGWVVPDAIVSFFMLHHLDDPGGFFRSVRAIGKAAPVALAVYGPADKTQPAAQPPRTLIHWNTRSLHEAFSRAGYAPEVRPIRSTGVDIAPVAFVRAALTHTRVMPSVYRLGKRVEALVLRLLPRRVRRETHVIVAFAGASAE